MDIKPTIEGLRAARNLVYKQWCKERQRAVDMQKRNDALLQEIQRLKGQIEIMLKSYL